MLIIELFGPCGDDCPHSIASVFGPVGMTGFSDDWILEYAANEGRIVITHDIRTMPAHATDRIKKNLYLPGLIVVPDTLDIATTVNDLEVIIVCATEAELQNRIYFLPI
jgi:hypothetical protein